MTNLAFELVWILLLLLLNGFFAMSEIAILSSRKPRLKQKADDGQERYKRVLAIAQRPGPFLSTMQVGITLISILTGALGEATLSEALRKELEGIPWLAPLADAMSFVIVVVGITLMSVFVGELTPKRIALSNPEKIAAAVVVPVKFFSVLFYPIERFLTWASDGILKALGIKPNSDPPVTEEELKVMLREGRDAGVFHEVEQNLAETMLTLDDKGTHGYLTQRVDVLFFERDEDGAEVRKIVLENPDCEAFPVCEGGLDHVVGVVDARRILAALAEGRFTGLAEFIEEPAVVPVSVSPLKVLGVFKAQNAKMVLVVDEYGGIQGVMTLRNILEKLFGEIVVADADAPRITKREDGSYLIDGVLDFGDFAKFFDCEKEWETEKGEYHTLAGFILKRLGRIPSVANYFVWKTFYFEVLAMDGNRVDQVLVRRFEKKAKPASAV
jgi:putative hemolysin